MSPRSCTSKSILSLLLASAFACTAWSAQPDRYLPNDSRLVITLDFQRLLKSKFFDTYGRQPLEKNLDRPKTQTILQALNFDPVKDIKSLTVAVSNGTDSSKGLIILHGDFDVRTWRSQAELVSQNDDFLSLHKIGKHTVYEFTERPKEWTNQPIIFPVFVAILDEHTLIASSNKNYIREALDKSDGKKKSQPNQHLQDALRRLGPKTCLSFCLTADYLSELFPGEKKTFELAYTLSGSFTVTDEITLSLAVAAKNGDAAKEIQRQLNEGMEQAKAVVNILKLNKPQLAPLADVLDTIVIERSKEAVTLEGKVSADLLKKVIRISK
ncbi:MAG: hypothetical protein KatS3mg105_4806 [Gemmatales bacterium]|nr:MAG: hypothetical protein KatS3mg105_4806 [Gemmatales bacterium]